VLHVTDAVLLYPIPSRQLKRTTTPANGWHVTRELRPNTNFILATAGLHRFKAGTTRMLNFEAKGISRYSKLKRVVNFVRESNCRVSFKPKKVPNYVLKLVELTEFTIEYLRPFPTIPDDADERVDDTLTC
jgi:hypothetical protein